MNQWVYTTVTAGRRLDGDYDVQMRDGSASDQSIVQGTNRLASYLNLILGPDGWELCSSFPADNGGMMTLIFKRPR